MSGLLGKKIGMTSIYDEAGKMVPVTVIEAGPCVVTQVRTIEKDGYSAIQLGFDEKKEKNATKAEIGHFAKAGTTPKKLVREFSRFEEGHSSKKATENNWAKPLPSTCLWKASLLMSAASAKVKASRVW